MKKVLGPILGLILVLLLASPWFVGKQTETFYNQATEQALLDNPALKITNLTYQRGWFSSTVTGGISIKTVGQDIDLPFELRFKSVVTHGPIFWRALSSGSAMGLAYDASTLWVEATNEEEEELTAVLKDLPPLEMKSVVGFDKMISSVYTIAAYAKTIESGDKPTDINFEGLNGTGSFNWETKDFDIKAQVPAFTVTESDSEKLTINDVMLTGYKKGGDTSARYDIARIAMNSEESNIHFALDKPYLAGSTTEAGEIYNSALESGFETLAANELSYAPAKLHLKFDNLDKASIDALRETINEATANADEMGSDMYGMMLMGKMMELLPEMLKRDPKFTLAALNLGTGNGEALTASGYAAILGEEAVKLPSMALMMQALDAHFEAKLPKAFLNTFMDLGKLMQLMDQGFLVADEKYYSIEAVVKEGHLTLNGNTIM